MIIKLVDIPKNRLKKIIHYFSEIPFKASILWLFLPFILFCLIATGIITYTFAKQQIEENSYRNIMDTVLQTRKYIESRLSDVFEQFVALENDSDMLGIQKRLSEDEFEGTRPEDYIIMDKNMERIYSSYYSILDSIYICLNDSKVVFYKKDYISSNLEFSFNEWRSKYNHSSNGYYWLNVHKNNVFNNIESNKNVASLFKLIGTMDSRLNGIIMFNFREDYFKSILQNPKISKNGYMLLLSKDGILSYKDKSKYMMNDDIVDDLIYAQSTSGKITFKNSDGDSMIAIFDTIKTNNWKVVAVIPEKEVLSRANYIKYVITCIGLVLVVIAVFISNLLAKIIARPILRLTNKVKLVAEGEMDVPFDINVDNEIGILNSGISKLISTIKTLIKQVKEEQEKKRKTELAVLQAQINPHFLYNTLYSIKQLCDMGNTDEASEMVSALSNFFRIGISRGKELISIDEEIEHVKNYLIIQKMRYDDDFEYEINMDEDILHYKILKLTLQPLVENAIYHGVKQKRGRGIIRIDGIMCGDIVVLEVSDNGAGMCDEKLNQIKYSLNEKGNPEKITVGFGLRNVHQRLKIQFGERYGIEIKSIINSGTTIRVEIPMLKGE